MSQILEHLQNLDDTKVLILGQVGSKAYGTDTPQSDDDYMGITLAPMSCYTGLKTWRNDGTLELKTAVGDDVDASVYEIKKFFNLCLNFNPNVIPLLYLRKKDYLHISPGGQMILDNRQMFESKKAYYTFVNYAKHQLDNVKRGVTGKYGAKRKALIEEYGYDIKFAYHTIRLLSTIYEFFNTQKMNIYRGYDISYLMDIRKGKVSQTEFFEAAEFLIKSVDHAFKKATWLADEPAYARANTVCMNVVKLEEFHV